MGILWRTVLQEREFGIRIDLGHTEEGSDNVFRVEEPTCLGRLFGLKGERGVWERAEIGAGVFEDFVLGRFRIERSDDPRTVERIRQRIEKIRAREQ